MLLQFRKFVVFSAFFSAVLSLVCVAPAFADGQPEAGHRSLWSRLGATIGGDYDLGGLGNGSIDVPPRTMSAISIEGMAGYRIGHFTVGPDFDYRWESQLSSLGAGNGTNLRGQGWLLGLGGIYDIAPRWSVQAAVDFVGDYIFNKQTSASEDDRLENPLVVRAKGQYYAFTGIPLSLDLDLQYVSYGKWHVSSVDYTSPTNGYFVGVGLTWHFGERLPLAVAGENVATTRSAVATPAPEADVTKEVIVAPTHTVTPAQVQEFRSDLEKIVDVKKTDNGLMVSIKGDASFTSASSELTAESKANLQKTAEVLAKKPGIKLTIEGHSDSSGNKAMNQTLSDARAKSVKEVFVAAGLKSEDITAKGMGDSQPIVSNKTKKGRATNRRVEIYIGQ